MPYTEHDNNNPGYHLDDDGLTQYHGHYVGTTDPDDLAQLDHGKPVHHFTCYRGDWYAVHTH